MTAHCFNCGKDVRDKPIFGLWHVCLSDAAIDRKRQCEAAKSLQQQQGAQLLAQYFEPGVVIDWTPPHVTIERD